MPQGLPTLLPLLVRLEDWLARSAGSSAASPASWCLIRCTPPCSMQG